jgi:hypothetical protein
MKYSTMVAMLLGLALSACGGGDESNPPGPLATQQVPASASASVGGLMSYLKVLVGSDANALEPVDVSAVAPPRDDAAEPAVVD